MIHSANFIDRPPSTSFNPRIYKKKAVLDFDKTQNIRVRAFAQYVSANAIFTYKSYGTKHTKQNNFFAELLLFETRKHVGRFIRTAQYNRPISEKQFRHSLDFVKLNTFCLAKIENESNDVDDAYEDFYHCSKCLYDSRKRFEIFKEEYDAITQHKNSPQWTDEKELYWDYNMMKESQYFEKYYDQNKLGFIEPSRTVNSLIIEKDPAKPSICDECYCVSNTYVGISYFAFSDSWKFGYAVSVGYVNEKFLLEHNRYNGLWSREDAYIRALMDFANIRKEYIRAFTRLMRIRTRFYYMYILGKKIFPGKVLPNTVENYILSFCIKKNKIFDDCCFFIECSALEIEKHSSHTVKVKFALLRKN
jgi:hypothetical protein